MNVWGINIEEGSFGEFNPDISKAKKKRARKIFDNIVQMVEWRLKESGE